MAPSGVHSRTVGTPKRVPVRVSFTVTVRFKVQFGHSELVLEFLQLALEPQRS